MDSPMVRLTPITEPAPRRLIRLTPSMDRLQGRRVLRHALQGGTALAAGAYAAEAVRCGDFTRAVLATAVGAAGVYALERLLKEPASVESAPALQDASHE